ncbi:ankyrin repeat domain-containing protein [Candidatus Micrarchaeota archaeon]|nr:ankyrin repeat domain-containing protein [Candidatus Micrarchaeota archaeon]
MSKIEEIEELMSDILTDDLEEVKEKLKAGFDPNSKAEDLTTPLMLAAMNNRIEILELLLKFKANPNETDRLGQSPLEAAFNYNYRDAFLLLLDHGADPNQPDNQGLSIAAKCIIKGEKDLIEQMIKRKIDLSGSVTLKITKEAEPLLKRIVAQDEEDANPIISIFTRELAERILEEDLSQIELSYNEIAKNIKDTEIEKMLKEAGEEQCSIWSKQ